MKQIPPIPLKDKYWLDIQKEIERIFNEVLFIPLYKAVGIPVKEVRNAPSTPLEKAIAEGKVWYADGKFHSNQWNAALSRELKEMGATFNAASKTWAYTAALPAGVSFAAAAAAARYDAIKKAVIWTLDQADIKSIDNLGNLPDRFTRTIEWLDGDFNKALKGITIPPQLTEGEKNGIAVDYSHNMGLFIKKWTEETILELRQDVERMVYAGKRPDAISRLIQTKYGQSKRKAAFLASQETRLLKGTFDRERAKSVGSQKYVWRGRMDARERDSHVELEGEVIFIDSPPVVDHKTGRRAHAGEDYNCFLGQTKVFSPVPIEKLYRRRYSGKLSTLQCDTGETLCATVNHPVLTKRGWIPANQVNVGDYIAKIGNERLFVFPENPKGEIATFDKFYSFFSVLPFCKGVSTTRDKDFHGDISIDHEVDVINVEYLLRDYAKPTLNKHILDNIFTESDILLDSVVLPVSHDLLAMFPTLGNAPDSVMRGLCQAHTFLFGGVSHTGEHGFAPVSWLYTVLDNMVLDGLSSNPVFVSKGLDTCPRDISFYRLLFWEVLSIGCDVMSKDFMPCLHHTTADHYGAESMFEGDLPSSGSFDVHFYRVTDNVIRDSDSWGHIYNLQNSIGWYYADDFIVKNCRCIPIYIIE